MCSRLDQANHNMRVAAAVLCTVLAGTTARSAAASASDGGFELDLLLHTAMTAHAVPELDEPTELGSLAYTSSAADIGLRRSLRISETIVGRASPGDGGKVHFYRQLPPVVKLDHVTAWLSDDVEGGSKRGKLSLSEPLSFVQDEPLPDFGRQCFSRFELPESTQHGANLSYYIGRPAMILVATGAIVTDLMFFAGSAIFPLCSVVTTGRGFGIDGAVGLVVYYVGFFFAFKYVDKILEQQCPMPPQIKAMNLPGVLRSIQMMLPPWLQVIPACIVVYVWAMLYLVTGLIAKELAVPFICLAANGVVAGVALPLLKASIAESRKAGKSTGFVKACFLLQLLEPVVALVMFLTVGLEVGVQVCGVATLLGAAYGYKTTASLRAAQAQMANVPFKPAPLQRMKGLRPKQRALLEAQLAAKEARKAKSDASLTPSV